MIVAPPKAGRRGEPYAPAHEGSVSRAMDRGKMPKTLGALLTWYAREWDGEVPTRLHTVEVWNGRQERRDGQPVWPSVLVGGSALGAHAHADGFRRYLENYASELDEDGYFVRPMHAALHRLGTRDFWMARNLFAIAQAGYDWKGVADRGHWVHEMYAVYIAEALRRLWLEYTPQAVRLQ